MLLKFLSNNEPLELDLLKQIKKSNYNIKTLSKAIVIKIFRKSYKFFQRLLLKPSIRKKLSELERLLFKNRIDLNKPDNFVSINGNVNKFKKDSFAIIDNVFSKDEIKEIKKTFSSKKIKLDPIYGDFKKFSIKDRTIRAHTGYVPTEEIFKNEIVIKGATNKDLLNTLKFYFGTSFKLDWIWCWWSIPTDKPLGPQLFHRDYESMNFVKFFVYLTDVNEKNGPHQIISGSHNDDFFYKRERFDDDEIKKKYKKKINTICGDAGTNFLANTFSIHKGKFPKEKKRLVLVYLFSIVPSNRCPKLPFMNIKNIKDKKLLKEIKKNKKIFDQIYSF